jgi:hypothetical protein
LCSSLRMKLSSLPPPQRALAGAPQEDRCDLFFITSVENRESPLYTGYRALSRYTYARTPTREPRGYPLRAWEREGRVHPPPSSDPHEPPSCLCRATWWRWGSSGAGHGCLTRFSANNEYTSITFLETTQSLSNALRVDSTADCDDIDPYCTPQTHVSLWLRPDTAPMRDRQTTTSLPYGEK